MHEQDEELWDGDELRPEIRERLVRLGEPVVEGKAKTQMSQAQLLAAVPVYLGILGLFFSGANVYANTMTRVATMEARIDLITTMISDMKTEMRYDREQRNQPKR